MTASGDTPPRAHDLQRGHVAFPPGSRFLMLPRRPRRAARAGLALWEAVEPRQRLAVSAGVGLTTAGLAPLLPTSDRAEVDWAWWESFAGTVVQPLVGTATIAAFRIPGNPRVSALLMDGTGRPLAFAKLLNSATPHVAAAASRLLAERPTRTFRVPTTLAEGEHEGWHYRVLEPLPEGPHAPPPHDPTRLAAVVDELHERLSGLDRTSASPSDVACHADLTPRNLRRARDGAWWLFDWDNVRFGPRLSDEVRYWCAAFAYRRRPDVERDSQAILSLLRRRGSDDEIRAAVQWPGRVGQTYRDVEHALHDAIGRMVGAAS